MATAMAAKVTSSVKIVMNRFICGSLKNLYNEPVPIRDVDNRCPVSDFVYGRIIIALAVP